MRWVQWVVAVLCSCCPAVVGATSSLEGGLMGGLPAALPAGLSMGVGGSAVTAGPLAWGARLSWSTATEYTEAWAVRHDETRLRALLVLQRRLGRGTVGLRMAPGLTVLHETAERAQSARLTTSGLPLADTRWVILPALDLEAAVVLRVAGDFGMIASAGPTVHVVNGGPSFGWTGTLGVAWLP